MTARTAPAIAETFGAMVREANRQGVVVLADVDGELLLYGNVDGMDPKLRELVMAYPGLIGQALQRLLETDEA